MNKSQELLSNIVTYTKYAKYIKALKRRETWSEIINRYKNMLIGKYCVDEGSNIINNDLYDEVNENICYLRDKEVLPSMRALQFAGPAIEVNESRIYNCSYLPIDDIRAFSETMFLLLGGTGVGYSVQKHHVENLPEITHPTKKKKYLIADSIEGWADAIKALFKAYTGYTSYKPTFDYRDIRPKGASLITAGGKAPGPEPLRLCLTKIEGMLSQMSNGDQLTPLQCHDILCHIADSVLSGGIRRAAMISLFSQDDKEMLTCKAGNWWELNPQRGRANNSAVMVRGRAKKDDFIKLWKFVEDSGAGEPGVYWTNDPEYGTNPSLRAGTRVLTKEGVFPIEQLDGKSFIVPNLNGEWSEAKCWLSGKDKPLWKLTLDTGESYYSTTEHEWPVYCNGRFLKSSTDKLNSGDKLPVNIFNRDKMVESGDLGTYNEGFMAGWLYGDGWITNRENDKTQMGFIVSYKDGEDIKDLLLSEVQKIDSFENRKVYKRGNCWEFHVGNKSFRNWMDKMSCGKKEEGLPSKIWTEYSEEARRGFIDGLFSSDGHVPNDNHGINLVSKHESLIKDVQDLLGFYGIKSSKTFRKQYNTFGKGKVYTSYTVRTTLQGKKKFEKLFNLSVGHKQKVLTDTCLLIDNKEEFVNLVSVELTELKEDVWDISVKDDTHCFHLPQVTTGNCCEISLRPFTFCNLTEINAGSIEDQKDFNNRCKIAAFFGTLQAGFTDFHYLRPIWKKNTEKDALIGVGITGICNGNLKNINLFEGVQIVKDENERVSKIIGIKNAARTTTVKPSGTTSCVVGTSSGIHAWHSKYYIRNMQCTIGDDLYNYFVKHHPTLIKDMDYQPGSAVIGIPQMAPDTAILREDENALSFLSRVNRYNLDWVREGHRTGPNTNNVSATCSVDSDEWEDVGEWMWKNRDNYNGLSVLPYDGGTYKDAPFITITEEEYENKVDYINNNPIELTLILEDQDNTTQKDNLACSGDNCQII